MRRSETIRFTGTFVNRDEAAASLKMTGDMALVTRGVPRMVLMDCPCGCRDVLVANLDLRAGPAWRIYRRGKAISLFPSYWRDTKCKSHFILWKNHIYWCEWDDEEELWTSSSAVEESVLRAMSEDFVNYELLAEKLGEIPWDVLQACHALVRKGYAEMNLPRRKGEFRRKTKS
jgi:Family of unknown function (DUF6527)